MDTIKLLLQELGDTLRQYNPAAYENLMPPFTNEEIDTNLKKIGIEDENVKKMFQWKSGIKNEHNYRMMQFGGLLTFNSIKESISLNDYFDHSLIPLISDDEGEMLLFNKNSGPHYGKLYLFSVGSLYINHPISYYDSLYSMMRTVIDAYKKNAYEYDKENDWLDINDYQLAEIAKNYNPNSAYWTDHNVLKWQEWYAV